MKKFLLMTAIVLAPLSAHAATFTVNDTNDAVDANVGDGVCATASGTCTLRAAIQEANAKTDADTILLEGKTYLLGLVNNSNPEPDSALDASQGDLDIIHDLTITGTGLETGKATVIDAQKSFGVFHIGKPWDSQDPDPVVKIEKLVIKNGNGAWNGGGITITGSSALTLSETNIVSNKSAKGGGISLSQATVTVEKCEISQNTTTSGGAGIMVENGGTLTVNNSKIYMNNDNGSSGVDYGGGAIRIVGTGLNSGSVKITNSAIFENTTSGAGGGIVVRNALLTLLNSTVANNKADGGGGGILVSKGARLVFANSVLAGNSAAGVGSGLNNYGADNVKAEAFIISSTVTGNGTENGLVNVGSGVMTVLNSTVVGNGASGKAGVVNNSWTDGQIYLQNSIVVGNGGNDCYGGITSLGNNLVGIVCNGLEVAGTDKTGLTLETAGVGPLVDDKIAGHLHFQILDGPAIDGGNQDACAKGLQDVSLGQDQPGNGRLGVCDIGAIEATHMDGITQKKLGEECDDGNDNNDDGCLNTNKIAKCGDGMVWAGVEMCDDGNDVNDDMCPNTCKSPTCGDGIAQATNGETCDDGNQVNEDACLNSCVAAKCGDGIVQSGVDECDDSNTTDGDGCSALCKVEPKPVVATTEVTTTAVGGARAATAGTGGGETPAAPAGAGATTPTPAGGGAPGPGAGTAQAPATEAPAPASPAKGGCSLIMM